MRRVRRLLLVSLLVSPALIGLSSSLPARAGGENIIANGFDVCQFPSTTTMDDWYVNTSFYVVGLYILGRSRGCSQPNITAGQISHDAAEGWDFLPMDADYEPPQGCSLDPHKEYMDPNPATAFTQGQAQAYAMATNTAPSLSFHAGAPLYYDMEPFSLTSSCEAAVDQFVDGWDSELQKYGYVAGVYAQPNSSDWWNWDALASPPNVMWFTDGDNNPSPYAYHDGATHGSLTLNGSTTLWPPDTRAKQYLVAPNNTGPDYQPANSPALNIDMDCVEGEAAGPNPYDHPCTDIQFNTS